MNLGKQFLTYNILPGTNVVTPTTFLKKNFFTATSYKKHKIFILDLDSLHSFMLEVLGFLYDVAVKRFFLRKVVGVTTFVPGWML